MVLAKVIPVISGRLVVLVHCENSGVKRTRIPMGTVINDKGVETFKKERIKTITL